MAATDDRASASLASDDIAVDTADVGPQADGLGLLAGTDAGSVLAMALQEAGGELVWWRPQQVVCQPGRGTTASYRTRVRWPNGTVTEETLAGCTGHRLPGEALVLDDGSTRVAVWRFPHDPDLPGLPAACDEGAVARLLDELGLGAGAVRLRTRAYRPRRRAVIEAVGSRGRLFIKVVRPDRVEALHDRHRLLVRHGIPAPQSLGWTPQGILVLQALGGHTLRRTLRSRTAAIPTAEGILALLDRLPPELAQGPPRQTWLDKAPHYAAVIAAALPAQAARATRLAEALAATPTGGLPGPVHGDFYENQLLIDRGHICGLLDIDTAGPGDRVDDLACLVGHLSVLAQIDRDRAPIINRATTRYLTAFETVVPPPELHRRVAAVVLSLATGSHRVQEPDWPTTTRRRLDLAETWLTAAGRLRPPGT